MKVKRKKKNMVMCGRIDWFKKHLVLNVIGPLKQSLAILLAGKRLSSSAEVIV